MLPALTAAALIETAVTYPLDNLKIRLQTGQPVSRPTTWMYRGAGYRLAGMVPARAIFWVSMDAARAHVQSPIVAGGIAGTLQSVVDVPAECARFAKIAGERVQLRNMFRGALWNTARNAGFGAGVCAGREWSESPLGAGVGASVGVVLTHPFDTMKSRRQSPVIGSELRLWSGVVPRSILAFATMGVGAFVYDKFKTL